MKRLMIWCGLGVVLVIVFRGEGCAIMSVRDIDPLFARVAGDITERLEVLKKDLAYCINAITKIPRQQRTFANTVQAYDDAYRSALNMRVMLEAIEAVHPRKMMRDAATKKLIELAAIMRDLLTHNKGVCDAFVEYKNDYFSREQLDNEQRVYVHEMVRIFVHEGLNLPARVRARVKKITNELTRLTLQFGRNINEDAPLLLCTRAELDGVPAHVMDTFTLREDGRYSVVLDMSKVSALLNYAQHEDTRKRVYRSWNCRAYPNNILILQRVIVLRQELAKLLGYSCYSEYALALEMAGSVQKVKTFLQALDQRLSLKIKQEFEQWMNAIPAGCCLTDDHKFNPWDISYAQQCCKRTQLGIDERELMKFFPAQHVLEVILSFMGEFFGLRFVTLSDVHLWHADVQVVEARWVSDDTVCGYLILDIYQRAGKYPSAALLDIISAQRVDGIRCPAVALLIANVARGTIRRPSLLSIEDVVTLLHECGHAMHSLVNDTTLYAFASAINKMDFVEMPSQLFERVFYEKNMLKKMTKHYKTGQPLSDEIIDRVSSLEQFDFGYWHRLYSGPSLFLVSLYEQKSPNIRALCRKYMGGIAPDYVVWDDRSHVEASFLHMIDYGPKYYSYLWSKVLAADVYDVIKQRGGFTAAVGKRFVDQVLSKGGSIDPRRLLEQFLDRTPTDQAFFAVAGQIV